MTGKQWKEQIRQLINDLNNDPTMTLIGKVMGEIDRYNDFFDNGYEFVELFNKQANNLYKLFKKLDRNTKYKLMYGNK